MEKLIVEYVVKEVGADDKVYETKYQAVLGDLLFEDLEGNKLTLHCDCTNIDAPLVLLSGGYFFQLSDDPIRPTGGPTLTPFMVNYKIKSKNREDTYVNCKTYINDFTEVKELGILELYIDLC